MKFTDETPMPWGKHKGDKLADVPDSYLLWILDNPAIDRQRNAALFAYIEENLDAIQANIKNSCNGTK